MLERRDFLLFKGQIYIDRRDRIDKKWMEQMKQIKGIEQIRMDKNGWNRYMGMDDAFYILYFYSIQGDYGVREEIKKFSDWPTIPQLYVEQEFVGGADILIEMYQNGELKTMLDGMASKEKN